MKRYTEVGSNFLASFRARQQTVRDAQQARLWSLLLYVAWHQRPAGVLPAS